MMSNLITSFKKKSDDISDDVKKLETQINSKTNDNHNALIKQIEQLTINNTTELCNHTKHIASQHEAHVDETKRAMEDMRDDINTIQSKTSKTINDVHFKLNTAGKSGSMN